LHSESPFLSSFLQGAVIGLVLGKAVTIWLLIGQVFLLPKEGHIFAKLESKLDYANHLCSSGALELEGDKIGVGSSNASLNVVDVWKNRTQKSEREFFYVPQGCVNIYF
jgi:hypothetical protein